MCRCDWSVSDQSFNRYLPIKLVRACRHGIHTLTAAQPCVSQESLRTHLDDEINAKISEYAERYDLSESEAIEALLQTGPRSHRQSSSQASEENAPDQKELEQRQRAIANQQRQIVRFQKYTVFGGLFWAVLTLATGANSPVWVGIGMLLIVLMASSTYIWQYVPTFQ